MSYNVGTKATTDAAHNYTPLFDNRPEWLALDHPSCCKFNGVSVNGLGRGRDTVIECKTPCWPTAELAMPRVCEHYTDGPCPDSTGSTDADITNVACVVSDETFGCGCDTSTHGELRLVGVIVLSFSDIASVDKLGSLKSDSCTGYPRDIM